MTMTTPLEQEIEDLRAEAEVIQGEYPLDDLRTYDYVRIMYIVQRILFDGEMSDQIKWLMDQERRN